MSKWYLDCEEWYPVLTLIDKEFWSNSNGQPAEFSEAEIADLRRVMQEFNDWQKKLGEKFSRPANSYNLICLI